jgi:hypothetical protein
MEISWHSDHITDLSPNQVLRFIKSEPSNDPGSPPTPPPPNDLTKIKLPKKKKDRK